MDTNQNFGITVQAILDANAGATLQASLDKLTNLKINLNVNSNIKTDNVKNSVSKYSDALKETENSTTGLNGAVNSLIGNVGKVAAWSMATNAIYGTKQAMEEFFQNMVEIESKLVDLDRVTSGLDMSVVFDGAYEASQKYGSALYDTLDAVTEIGRSYDGLDEQQIVATSSAAILASTIADMSGEEAVKTIVAVSNAYGLLIEDSELLIDKINEVDNNYSVSSQTISEALRKSASTANVFGVELDDLIGYITAISATTQESGNVIGNSLKTILSRLTTMSEAESVLDDVGISIRDASGEMRQSSDILGELAGKWSSLTDEQRQNVGVQVAGRNQLTRFLALMENYDMATEASTTSLNSQGSAVRENIIYAQSYEAKLIQLENAQLGLAKAVGDSTMNEFGKTFLDARIALTETIAAILKFSDATTILISALGGLVLVLSQTANGKKILSQVTGLLISQEQQEANAALKNAQAQSGQVSVLTRVINAIGLKNIALEKAKQAASSYTEATKKTQLAQEMLIRAEKQRKSGADDLAKTSTQIATGLQKEAQQATTAAVKFKIMGVAAQVAGVLMQAAFTLGIGIIIGAIVNKVNDFIGAAQKAQDAALESANELDNWTNSMNSNKDKITEYKTALDAHNLSVEDAKTYKENLMTIQDELIEKYGKEAESIDLVNGNLKDQIALIDELMQKDAQDWINKNSKAIDKANKVLNETKESYETMYGGGSWKQASLMRDQASAQGLKTNSKEDAEKIGYSQTSIYGKPEELIKYWSELSTYIQKNKAEIKEVYDLTDAQLQEVLNDAGTNIEKLEKKYAGHIEVLDKFGEEALLVRDDYKQFLQELQAGSEDGSLSGEDIKELLNSHEGLSEAFEKSGISLEKLITLYEVLPDVTSDANDENFKFIANSEILNEEIEALNSNLDSLQNAYSTIASAVDEYNESGYLTIDTMQSLLDLDERYLMTLLDANGNIHLNADAHMTAAEAMLREAEAAATNSALTDLMTLSNDASSTSAQNVVAKYQILTTKLGEVSIEYEKLAAAAATARTAMGETSGDGGTVDNIMATYKAKMAIIEKTRTGLNTSLSKSMGGSKSSSSAAKEKKYFDYVQERLDNYKNNIDAIDLELKIVQERFKNLTEGSPEWFANLRQQESIIKRRQQATLEYIYAIQRELTSNKLSNEERVKLNNTLQQQTLEYEKQNTALKDLVETEKDYYKSQIKDKINTLKDLENERHDQVIDNIKKERDAFKKAVENQIALIKRVEDARKFDKELDKLQAEKQTVQDQINRLQGDTSRLANTKRLELEQELADLEDQILEHQIDRQNELREENLNNLADQKEAELDIYEEAEDAKHELILNNLEQRSEALDDLNISISDLNNQLSELSNILNNFPSWADTFNVAAGVQNLNSIFGTTPFSLTNPNNQSTQTFIINVAANSEEEGQAAGQAIIDELKKSGIIVSGNGY